MKEHYYIFTNLLSEEETKIITSIIHHIERGYEDIVRKLSGVGADIRVVVTPDEEKQSQVG
jgi:UDP-N-acetylglucosamine enolpyruvyl transferase